MLTSILSIGTRNNYTTTNDIHHKTGLVEVVEVRVFDRILLPYIIYQSEPRLYKLRIFTEGPLFVVDTRKSRLKLKTPSYKTLCPVNAGRAFVTYCEEKISHIFHSSDSGRKSSRI